VVSWNSNLQRAKFIRIEIGLIHCPSRLLEEYSLIPQVPHQKVKEPIIAAFPRSHTDEK
jgi:hypothetical protein